MWVYFLVLAECVFVCVCVYALLPLYNIPPYCFVPELTLPRPQQTLSSKNIKVEKCQKTEMNKNLNIQPLMTPANKLMRQAAQKKTTKKKRYC